MAVATTVTVESALREDVREELRKVMDLDALVEPDAVEAERIREIVRGLVEAASHRAVSVGDGPIVDREALTQRLVDEILGLGPLQPLLDDPAIEEIIVNGRNAWFAFQMAASGLRMCSSRTTPSCFESCAGQSDAWVGGSTRPARSSMPASPMARASTPSFPR